MANIDIRNISDLNISDLNISDLNLNGNSLFDDSESFITEIDDNAEQETIMGGIAITSGCCISGLRLK